MPAHNTEQFVGAAIASALNQTVDQIELIVVDDGSTDGTRATVESWCRRDARVGLLANGTVHGSSRARNTGMMAARGPFFAFLDSDDEWLPGFLQAQLSAFDEFPDASVVTGNAVSVGGPLDGRPLRRVTGGRRRLALLEMIEREESVNIMSVFRREVFDTIGGFDHGFCQSEDYDFWLRAATAGFVFVQTSEPLVRYRRRRDGLSADELKMHAGIIAALTKALSRLEDRPAERAALDKQIARFERQMLALRAKTALRAREFATAATWFQALFERDRRPSRAALAAFSRVAPAALWWADRLRTRLRRQPHALSSNISPTLR
jgi:glycosyltransferase involved in cell wall biosynthesis